jgi:hypothetical protein
MFHPDQRALVTGRKKVQQSNIMKLEPNRGAVAVLIKSPKVCSLEDLSSTSPLQSLENNANNGSQPLLRELRAS